MQALVCTPQRAGQSPLKSTPPRTRQVNAKYMRDAGSQHVTSLRREHSVTLNCISMQEPFCSLLMCGIKTEESRNNNGLSVLEGQRLAVRLGFKTWEGSKNHLTALQPLPPHLRGQVVGTVLVGRTRTKEEAAAHLSSHHLGSGGGCDGWGLLERQVCLARAEIPAYVTTISEPRLLLQDDAVVKFRDHAPAHHSSAARAA